MFLLCGGCVVVCDFLMCVCCKECKLGVVGRRAECVPMLIVLCVY